MHATIQAAASKPMAQTTSFQSEQALEFGLKINEIDVRTQHVGRVRRDTELTRQIAYTICNADETRVIHKFSGPWKCIPVKSLFLESGQFKNS